MYLFKYITQTLQYMVQYMNNDLQFMIGIDLLWDVQATQLRGILITYASNKKKRKTSIRENYRTKK